MLKFIYKLTAALLCACVYCACNEEDKLESRFEFKLGNFDFPQGNDEWDEKIVDIFNEYSVRLIYKNITTEDLQRSWTGGSSTETAELKLEELTSDELLGALDLVEKFLLPWLSSDMRDKMLPPYIYLGKFYVGLSPLMPGMTMELPYSLAGMDHWVFSMFYWARSPMPEIWPDQLMSLDEKDFAEIVFEIYEKARVERKIFTIPAAFKEGIDYTTDFANVPAEAGLPVITEELRANPDFYLNRGFIDNVQSSWEWDASRWGAMGLYGNVMASQYVSGDKDYRSYVMAMMIKPESFLREKYAGYELINKRFDILYKMFDDMGINLHDGYSK